MFILKFERIFLLEIYQLLIENTLILKNIKLKILNWKNNKLNIKCETNWNFKLKK